MLVDDEVVGVAAVIPQVSPLGERCFISTLSRIPASSYL